MYRIGIGSDIHRLALGRPLILGVNGQAREVLDRSRCGLHIEPENPAALCDAILQFRDQDILRESCGRNGRDYIVQNLSRESTAAAFLEVLSLQAFGEG